ncbi:LmeA family phospholipid-binding protein [Nocardia niigatensis]|uniref:LmeA family phospholipid-binding protein n=1 Tax=Nocardia niigatensis TaxID=209249 RepID=UPI0002E24653|nr:LmeA family phospholipid-binding protein [Nocardia niigatensis]
MRFRRLLIGLLCLAGLAVLLDFGVAAYSEYRVSRLLRTASDLSADPEITIHESLRHPFVAQALDGQYGNIDIRARAMRPDIPGRITVEANLKGVHLSMPNLIDGKVGQVPVDEVQARMRIEPTELGRLFKIPDLQVFGPPTDKSDASGGTGSTGKTNGGTIILEGTVPIGTDADLSAVTDTRGDNGEKITKKKVHVLADLRLDGDQIRITATAISGRDLQSDTDSVLPDQERIVISEQDRPIILARFTHTIDTRNMPFGIAPTRVEASGGQIVVEGDGRNATVDLDRLQKP